MERKEMETGIRKVKAHWILNSLGIPTVECIVWVGSKICVRASSPQGVAVGDFEALEVRDFNKHEFIGRGVSTAVENVNQKIAPLLVGKDCRLQKEIDQIMIDLDQTKLKKNIGVNAILPVSMCVMKAASLVENIPLYNYISTLAFGRRRKDYLLPIPFVTMMKGSNFGDTIHDILIMPIGANNFAQATQMVAETYQTLRSELEKVFGPSVRNVCDEGEFAPTIDSTSIFLDFIESAIAEADYEPRRDIVVGIDAGASEFYDSRKNLYFIDGKQLNPDELQTYWKDLVLDYEIAALIDPFMDQDFDSHRRLTSKLNGECQVVGADLFVSNKELITYATGKKVTSAISLKINQIGTMTEILDICKEIYQKNLSVLLSGRWGETCDTTLADLAVGLGCGQVKPGAPCRTEHTAKYNRILRIEEELKSDAKYPRSLGDRHIF